MTRFRTGGDFYPLTDRRMDRQSVDVLLLSMHRNAVSFGSSTFQGIKDVFLFKTRLGYNFALNYNSTSFESEVGVIEK